MSKMDFTLANGLLPTYRRLPRVFVRGEGVWLFDQEGRSHLDFLAGLGVSILGHADPNLVAAVQEQSARLWHVSNLYYTDALLELSEALWRQTGRQAFLCNSGAEANEAAFKLARKVMHQRGAPERYEIITFSHGFHGRTLATLAATANKHYQEGFAPLPEGFVLTPWNDLEALESAIGPHTAGVLIEPIQGEGGIHVASAEFLRGIERLTRESGVLFMVDEVQCGMGRSGRFFAHEWAEVRPDIVTVAKALAGGLPIGAMLAEPSIGAAFKPGDHGSTFGGNPVAARAALAVLQALEERDLLSHVQRMGHELMAGLQMLQQKHPAILAVRGLGLMCGLQLDQDPAPLVAQALESGLLVGSAEGQVLRLLPPLIVQQEHIERAVAILDALFGAREAS